MHQYHSGHATHAPIKGQYGFDCPQLIKIPLRKESILSSIKALGGKSKFEVPDMPDVVIQLEKEVNSRYPNSKRVIEIIESNAVIAGDLLAIVKSPTYMRHVKRAIEVKTISHIVSFIGIQQTYRLAMASAIKSIPAKSTLFREIIDHSCDVAVACAEVAGYVHGVGIEDAYLFGLFRDGGAIVMSAALDCIYEPYWERMRSFPKTGLNMEIEGTGARHDYLSVIAARQWGFGDKDGEKEMLMAIQEHHNYEEVRCFENEQVRILVAIGMIAEFLVNTINGEVYQGTESEDVMNVALDVLCIPNSVLSLIRKNLLSTLVSKV
jgi:HD-like signal output (HDOD) protein